MSSALGAPCDAAATSCADGLDCACVAYQRRVPHVCQPPSCTTITSAARSPRARHAPIGTHHERAAAPRRRRRAGGASLPEAALGAALPILRRRLVHVDSRRRRRRAAPSSPAPRRRASASTSRHALRAYSWSTRCGSRPCARSPAAGARIVVGFEHRRVAAAPGGRARRAGPRVGERAWRRRTVVPDDRRRGGDVERDRGALPHAAVHGAAAARRLLVLRALPRGGAAPPLHAAIPRGRPRPSEPAEPVPTSRRTSTLRWRCSAGLRLATASPTRRRRARPREPVGKRPGSVVPALDDL